MNDRALFEYLKANLRIGVAIGQDDDGRPEVGVWLSLRDPDTGEYVTIATDDTTY